MLVAVTTPTGNVGRHVVHGLLRAGLRPRVLVRDPDRLDPQVRERVDAVRVDQRDGDAVVEATRDVDALFWVVPSVPSPDPFCDYARFGAVAARAVTENAIARTVLQSSVGAELRQGAGEIDGLGHAEELLDATGRSVLHLRCGFFFSNLLLQADAVAAGVVPIVLPTDQPMPWVDPRDIADVATLRLLSTDWSGRVVQAVHGPNDHTWASATAVVAEVTGRSVRAERVPDDEMRAMLAGADLGDAFVEAVMGMSTGMRDGFVPEQPRDVTTTTSRTLDAWCREVLAPVLDARASSD